MYFFHNKKKLFSKYYTPLNCGLSDSVCFFLNIEALKTIIRDSIGTRYEHTFSVERATNIRVFFLHVALREATEKKCASKQAHGQIEKEDRR